MRRNELMKKRSLRSLIVLMLIFVMLLCSCSSAEKTSDEPTETLTSSSTMTNSVDTPKESFSAGGEMTVAPDTSSTSYDPVRIDGYTGHSEMTESVASDKLGGLFDSFVGESKTEESFDFTYSATDSIATSDDGWGATDGVEWVESEGDWGDEFIGDDISIIDDPYEPYINSIQPGAHMLTAGEWNDNKNFGFIKNLVKNGQDYNYAGLFANWEINPLKRVAVNCAAGSTPVVNATVQVYSADGSQLFWTGKSDNSGACYCFPGLFEDKYTGGIKVVVDNGTEVKERIFENGLDESASVNFNFDSAYNAEKKLELMYVVDTTGSMGDEITFLQCELADVIERVRKENSNIPVSLSVNFYKDVHDTYVVRSNPFSTNIDEQMSLMMKEYASGGGDYEEAVEMALDDAVNNHTWSEDATKILFLVLDAPPHNNAEVRRTLSKVIPAAAAKGIRIIPVAASGIDKDTEFLLRSFAMTTGGTYTFLTNDSGIGGSHIEASVGSYDVEYLNDLMVRVISEYIQDVVVVEEQEYGLEVTKGYEDDLVDEEGQQ